MLWGSCWSGRPEVGKVQLQTPSLGKKYSTLGLLRKLLPKLVRKHPKMEGERPSRCWLSRALWHQGEPEHHLPGNQTMCPRLLSWASRHRLGPEAGPPHTGRAANRGVGQGSVWESSHEVYDHLIHLQRWTGGPEPERLFWRMQM